MAGFEFTPEGIRELGLDPKAAGAVIPASSVIGQIKAAAAAQPQAAPVHAPAPKSDRKPLNVLDRRQFVRELKARLKLVQRELKQLRALEGEELELKRLIAAAKAPPAKVRDISTARKSG